MWHRTHECHTPRALLKVMTNVITVQWHSWSGTAAELVRRLSACALEVGGLGQFLTSEIASAEKQAAICFILLMHEGVRDGVCARVHELVSSANVRSAVLTRLDYQLAQCLSSRVMSGTACMIS